MAKPRESILNLFDPLIFARELDPSTPKRKFVTGMGTKSLEESDKENSEPNQAIGEVTAYFSKTYIRNFTAEPDPLLVVRPMERLVDVGDVTVVSVDGEEVGTALGSVLEDENEDAENDSVLSGDILPKLLVQTTPLRERPSQSDVRVSCNESATPVPRIPFTDITPESIPVARKRAHTCSSVGIGSAVSQSQHHLSPQISRAPPGSPLSTVFNSINFGEENDREDIGIPHIAVFSPVRKVAPSTISTVLDSKATAEEHPIIFASSTAHLVPSAPSALITNQTFFSESMCPPLSPPIPQTLRPRAHTTPTRPRDSFNMSSLEPISRLESFLPLPLPSSHSQFNTSVDLQASFNMHLPISDTEASFDLINDQMSFFETEVVVSLAESQMGSEAMPTSAMSPSVGSHESGHIRTQVKGADTTKSALESSVSIPSHFPDAALGDITMVGAFDVKDEEARMKAFLRLSSEWEGVQQNSIEDIKMEHEEAKYTTGSNRGVKDKSQFEVAVETALPLFEENETLLISTAVPAPESVLCTPQPKLRTRVLQLDDGNSPESTPKPPLRTSLLKQRFSSPLSAIPTFTKSPRSPNFELPMRSAPLEKQNMDLRVVEKIVSIQTQSRMPPPSPIIQTGIRTPSKITFTVPAPAPVPALRIVKRTVMITHGRSASTTSIGAASSTSGTSASTLSSAVTVAPATQTRALWRPMPPPASSALPTATLEMAAPVHKPRLQGLQRPRPSKVATIAAAPPKGKFGFTAKVIRPKAQGDEPVTTTAPANGVAPVVPVSRLVRPTSVIATSRPSTQLSASSTATGNSGIPNHLPSKLPPPSSRSLRQPSHFGFSSGSIAASTTTTTRNASATASRLPALSSGETMRRVGDLPSS